MLCAGEALMRGGRSADLLRIGVRTISAILIAWLTAIALWPWLQVGNPITQFSEAFLYFANHPGSFEFPHWGGMVRTTALPWSYVPAQLLVRLPEGFLLLLCAAVLSGLGSMLAILRLGVSPIAQSRLLALKDAVRVTAQARQRLIVWVAATLPEDMRPADASRMSSLTEAQTSQPRYRLADGQRPGQTADQSA